MGKELCVSQGLKAGVGQEDRIERLVEKMHKDGDINKIVSRMDRDARTQELCKWDKPSLLNLCNKLAIDPLMKDVMVERIMSYEADVEDGVMEPAEKKVRKC